MSKPGHLRRSKSPSVTDRAKEDGGGVCRSAERKIEVRDREEVERLASARQESGISGLVCIASQFRSAMRLGGMLHLARAVHLLYKAASLLSN